FCELAHRHLEGMNARIVPIRTPRRARSSSLRTRRSPANPSLSYTLRVFSQVCHAPRDEPGMQHKVPQLLSVWNPYFEPETIQVHVEILRQYRKVWWARLYRGERMDRAACRDKYARLAQLWDDARAEGRCVVLFVTNFVALHALLVDEILFGPELPPEEIAYAPAHYFQEPDDPKGPWPVLWFRVRDVRALAYDQVHTLRYFFDREIDAGDFGYDPFASFKWRYPEVAMAPPAEEIFDPELLAGRARMFADLQETLFPPEVQTARVELEKKLGETWLGLEERSRTFLASGWVVYRQFR